MTFSPFGVGLALTKVAISCYVAVLNSAALQKDKNTFPVQFSCLKARRANWVQTGRPVNLCFVCPHVPPKASSFALINSSKNALHALMFRAGFTGLNTRSPGPRPAWFIWSSRMACWEMGTCLESGHIARWFWSSVALFSRRSSTSTS